MKNRIELESEFTLLFEGKEYRVCFLCEVERKYAQSRTVILGGIRPEKHPKVAQIIGAKRLKFLYSHTANCPSFLSDETGEVIIKIGENKYRRARLYSCHISNKQADSYAGLKYKCEHGLQGLTLISVKRGNKLCNINFVAYGPDICLDAQSEHSAKLSPLFGEKQRIEDQLCKCDKYEQLANDCISEQKEFLSADKIQDFQDFCLFVRTASGRKTRESYMPKARVLLRYIRLYRERLNEQMQELQKELTL